MAGKNKDLLIYIVDDDPIYGRLIRKILYDYDFTNVQMFPSGEECVKNLYKNPEFIFLDYNMNGLNGLKVLKIIKEYNDETKVVIISAQEKIDIALKAIKLGAFDYVIKDDFVHKKLKDIIISIIYKSSETKITSI